MKTKTKRSIQWVKEPNQKYAGVHLISEFWGGKNIEDSKEIEKILVSAAIEGGHTPLKTAIYKFSPQGITGVVLLKESHIALHSWPELEYIAIDIFTCGEKSMPYKSLECLKRQFQPLNVKTKMIKRGIM